ncbi:MAG: tryptophan 7-halogenase [Planctomycetaceae bacterium]|nr:tryptophan 7-halogenase [Planctomycetaceae bacterium]
MEPSMNSGQGQQPAEIVVVGSGIAAWLSAAMLRRQLRPEHGRITVVEHPAESWSTKTPLSTTVTVGPAFVALLHHLGIPQPTLMQACDGVYCLGTQFREWADAETEFWLPFGSCGVPIDGRDVFHFWLAERKRGNLHRPYDAWSLHAVAAQAGRSPHSFRAFSPFTQQQSYGLQLNEERLADFLRQTVQQQDVLTVAERVITAERNGTGDLVSLQLQSGVFLAGDFFVDCSGADSVLIDQVLQIPWQERPVGVDRRLTIRTSARRIVPSLTAVQAVDDGWIETRPLTFGVDHTLKFSTDFTTEDAALRQLESHVSGLKRINDVTSRVISNNALRDQFWVNNVVAIDEVAWRCESPWSVQMDSLQAAVELFLRVFPTGGSMDASRKHFNAHCRQMLEQQLNWHLLPLQLNARRNGELWQAVRQLPLSSVMQHQLRVYDDCGVIVDLIPGGITESAAYFLLTGCQRLPRRALPAALAVSSEQIQEILNSMEQQNDEVVRDLALHEEMLDRIHRPPIARAS